LFIALVKKSTNRNNVVQGKSLLKKLPPNNNAEDGEFKKNDDN